MAPPRGVVGAGVARLVMSIEFLDVESEDFLDVESVGFLDALS